MFVSSKGSFFRNALDSRPHTCWCRDLKTIVFFLRFFTQILLHSVIFNPNLVVMELIDYIICLEKIKLFLYFCTNQKVFKTYLFSSHRKATQTHTQTRFTQPFFFKQTNCRTRVQLVALNPSQSQLKILCKYLYLKNSQVFIFSYHQIEDCLFVCYKSRLIGNSVLENYKNQVRMPKVHKKKNT